MTAFSKLILPNVRSMFIPGPGELICDADLSGADAQVVAWEADDADLKAAFRAGIKIHHKNATDMWGTKYTETQGFKKEQMYAEIKAGVHGTNYGAKPPTLATTLGWKIAEARSFQATWFALHPQIKKWQERVLRDITIRKMIQNAYGFRWAIFDRPANVFPEALAWGPQSTVAITSFRGALQVKEALSWVNFRLQVHDSLVFTIPKGRQADLPLVYRHLQNVIPFPDPLIIPWEVAVSDQSWGECRKMSWDEAATFKF